MYMILHACADDCITLSTRDFDCSHALASISENEAAIRIQAAARGHFVRKSLRFSQPGKPHDRALKCASPATRDFACSHNLASMSENEAAIRIQAAARGHLVRKSLRVSQPVYHALKGASPDSVTGMHMIRSKEAFAIRRSHLAFKIGARVAALPVHSCLIRSPAALDR
jgi:coenzyme F420-reducing hydrogenase alpha subunit